MQDLEKVVELGREFAKPWKQATKVLTGLLVVAVVALIVVSWRKNTFTIEADYNTQSHIEQTQG